MKRGLIICNRAHKLARQDWGTMSLGPSGASHPCPGHLCLRLHGPIPCQASSPWGAQPRWS